MSFGMITWNQNMDKKQNYVSWKHIFTVDMKTEDIYGDIGKDVEKRFDISNYKLDRVLPKGKNKTTFGLIKNMS